MRESTKTLIAVVVCGLCITLLCCGCKMAPVSAAELFGTSNPSMKVKVPGYGIVEIPTDFKGKFKIDRSPDGTIHVDITVDSKVSPVVEAEGERLKMMEVTRAAEFAARVEEAKIQYAFWEKITPAALSFLRSLIPVPTATGTPGDGPRPVPGT